MPAATTAGPITSADPEWVERRGIIFRFGDYPDRDFSLTPEEYAQANPDISEIPIDLSHTPTILDGSLGHLFAAEVKGDELHGSVRLPKWLDDLLDTGKRKVSCEWDRATKRLRKLSLVPEPRIPEAALYAAFASAGGPSMEIQTLVFDKSKFTKAQAIKWCKDHDFKAEVDETDDSYRMRQANPGAFEEGSFRTKALTDGVKAVMGKRKAKAAMAADDDPSDPTAALGSLVATFTARKQHPTLNVAMQHVHDLMALYPNGCPKVAAVAAFGDQTKQRKAVRALHDATLEHGATCPGGSKAKFGAIAPRRKSMSFAQKLGRVLFGGGVAEMELAPDISDDQAKAALDILVGSKAEAKADPPPPPASFAESPEGRAMAAEIADLKRKATEREAAERASRAATFAREATVAGHLTPHPATIAAEIAAQMLEDDARLGGTVTFSDGKETRQGSRFDAFAAFITQLPKHGLTTTFIDPNGQLKAGTEILFNRSSPAPKEDPEARGRRLYREGVGSAY